MFSWLKKRDKIALLIFVSFYFLFGLLLTVFQERVVYHPGSQDFMACTDLKDAERINYNGTRMYIKDTDMPTVVLYHGNAGSACDRSLYANIFAQAGYGYIIVEYAGYSNETRNPSHELIKNDVRNVVAYIAEYKLSDIAVVGESIGTGIASYHASLQAPGKLLLISPFTDLADVARERFWFYPTSALINNAFDNRGNLQVYRNPVTIIHGHNDEIIPYELGQELFKSLNNQQKFVTIEGAGHNDLFVYPEMYSAIASFLQLQGT